MVAFNLRSAAARDHSIEQTVARVGSLKLSRAKKDFERRCSPNTVSPMSFERREQYSLRTTLYRKNRPLARTLSRPPQAPAVTAIESFRFRTGEGYGFKLKDATTPA